MRDVEIFDLVECAVVTGCRGCNNCLSDIIVIFISACIKLATRKVIIRKNDMYYGYYFHQIDAK